MKFLERHKGWVTALGFYNVAPHESDVTKFSSYNRREKRAKAKEEVEREPVKIAEKMDSPDAIFLSR